MIAIEQVAQAALGGDALELRSLVQDWMRENPRINDACSPRTDDLRLRVVAAALVELLAERTAQLPPDWTAEVGALREPIFLLRSARTLPRLRRHCETESPPVLRRRGLLAPANYLSFA